MEGITEEDEIYRPIIINKRTTIMPDIATAIRMTAMANKLYLAVEKLKTLSDKELEIAHLKIVNYQGYTQNEKDYLINHIKNIYGENTNS